MRKAHIDIQAPDDYAKVWGTTMGDYYIDRNLIDFTTRIETLQKLTCELNIASILELGCNKGHNLKALKHLYPEKTVLGCEINRKAIARNEYNGIYECDINEGIPFKNRTFDLVFTAGVLIHIPPEIFPRTIEKMFNLSKKYLMAIEYSSDKDIEEVEYFDKGCGLWKRDFFKAFQQVDSKIRLIHKEENPKGFDRCTVYMIEKIL